MTADRRRMTEENRLFVCMSEAERFDPIFPLIWAENRMTNKCEGEKNLAVMKRFFPTG